MAPITTKTQRILKRKIFKKSRLILPAWFEYTGVSATEATTIFLKQWHTGEPPETLEQNTPPEVYHGVQK